MIFESSAGVLEGHIILLLSAGERRVLGYISWTSLEKVLDSRARVDSSATASHVGLSALACLLIPPTQY